LTPVFEDLKIRFFQVGDVVIDPVGDRHVERDDVRSRARMKRGTLRAGACPAVRRHRHRRREPRPRWRSRAGGSITSCLRARARGVPRIGDARPGGCDVHASSVCTESPRACRRPPCTGTTARAPAAPGRRPGDWRRAAESAGLPSLWAIVKEEAALANRMIVA
jgi:hypothetical protein